ncbi:MAG: hypothetical protein R3F07_17165 [Opitutaceae bacterium]
MLASISHSARGHFNRWGLCLILAGVFGSIQVQAQVNSDGFNPNLDGTVQAVLIQSDGGIILGGAFTSVRPGGASAVGRHNLVRYRPDGSLDESFDPNLNGAVNVLALQPDGRILVGGRFTTADPNRTGSPVVRNGLLRLNANGTLDSGFNPNLVGDRNPEVMALAVQADGKVAFGGRFNQIQPGGAGETVTRNYLARVNANGSLDTGFDPNPNNIVYSLAADSAGRLIVGGGFTQMQPGASAATGVSRIARLDASGAIDSSFTIKADNRVLALTFEADGSLLIGGEFHSLLQGGSQTAIDRLFVARIMKDGSIDGDFRPNANASVNGIAIQADGRILLAGGFTGFLPPGASNPISQRYLARINPGGSLDSTFNAGPNFRISAVAVGPDGSIVVGGAFTRFRPASSTSAINRNRAARIYPDGSLDAASTLDGGGSYSVLARLPDNSILAAGDFSSAGGLNRLNMVKLGANGLVSNTFTASTNGVVRGAVVQNDGKIVIVGEFNQVNDVGRQGAARLNADGSLDTAFQPSANAPVHAVALASDGKIYIGGAFTSLNPNLSETAVPRAYLARLNADGTVDPDFSPGLGGDVESLALQSDGALLVGGSFTFILPQGQEGSLPGVNLVRFKSDGAFDDTFRPGPNSTVSIITVQADGRILIGGQFTGLLPAGSEVLIPRAYVARVMADGTLDEGFDPRPNGSVEAIAETGGERVLLGGRFTWLNPNGAETPVYRDRFVRLNADGTVDASLSVAADDVVRSFLQESNGDVLIGGTFSGLVAFTGQAGTTTGRLGRLKSDGNLDFTFSIRADNAAGSEVVAIAPQNDGTLLVGGTFANLGGGSNLNAARLFSDGSIDRSFASQVNGPVRALLSRPNRESDIVNRRLFALLKANGTVADQDNPADGGELSGQVLALVEQADGKLIAGGSFTDGNGQIGPYLVRFNLDGSVDSSFKPILNGPVLALALQSDGKLLVGGSFSLINGSARNRIARIDTNGELDATFDPNAGNVVYAIALQPDGKILIGGTFTTLQPNGAATSTTRSRLARLNTDGTVDAVFNPAPNDRVVALAVQSDGQILMGGDFSSLAPNGGTAVARLRLARVTAAGEVDATLNPQVGGPVFSIAVQGDGKFVIGGSFVGILPAGATEAVTRNALARFNSDGTLDTEYDPNPNASVSVVRLQSDGKILVGGVFTSFRPNQSDFSIRRNRIARLNPDGTPDSAFNPNADSNVSTIKVRQDGTIAIGGLFSTLQQGAGILLGGAFSAVNGVAVSNLARVNSDGTPDTLFSPNPDRPVDGFILQPDGRTVVIGEFTSIAGQTRNRIARFDPDGALESGFNPGANGTVSAAALQADGKSWWVAPSPRSEEVRGFDSLDSILPGLWIRDSRSMPMRR